MADEDTTLLGEQLARLGVDHRVDTMEESTRIDYQAALDAYESAKRAVPRLTRPDEVSTVVDTLSTGRYALACVQARLEGRPIPELRVPCFFNPQHGPSVRDVLWTAPGRGTRNVPACAQDASRVANGQQPDREFDRALRKNPTERLRWIGFLETQVQEIIDGWVEENDLESDTPAPWKVKAPRRRPPKKAAGSD